eukprot:538989-Prorocentrum_minimum.AAC.1
MLKIGLEQVKDPIRQDPSRNSYPATTQRRETLTIKFKFTNKERQNLYGICGIIESNKWKIPSDRTPAQGYSDIFQMSILRCQTLTITHAQSSKPQSPA